MVLDAPDIEHAVECQVPSPYPLHEGDRVVAPAGSMAQNAKAVFEEISAEILVSVSWVLLVMRRAIV